MAFLTIASHQALADNFYWVGGSSAWTDQANWNITFPDGPAGRIPGAGDNVRISSGTPNPILSSSVTIGTMNVESGSSLVIQGTGTQLNTGRTDIGAHGTGKITVQSNASWVNSADLYLSSAASPGASGTLEILNGGKVTNEAAYIGYWRSGFVTVAGTGSTWTSNGFVTFGAAAQAGENPGSGSLGIQAGGKVYSKNGVVVGSLGTGFVSVTGTGSLWDTTNSTNDSNLNLGAGAGSSGTLHILSGGTVTSNAATVGDLGNGSVLLIGGTWNVDALRVAARDGGTGKLDVLGGGTVSSGLGVIGGGGGASNTVLVSDTGSKWEMTGDLYLGGDASHLPTISQGSLTIADSGEVSARHIRIASDDNGRGILNIGAAPGGAAAAPGTLTLTGSPGLSPILVGNGAGEINFNHTSGNYVFGYDLPGNLTVNTYAGTTVLTGANTYTGPTNVNGGTLQVDGTIAGTSGVNVNSSGVLTGVGTIGPLTVAINSGGTFAPGNGTPGTSTTIGGNLAFQPGAIYQVQVDPSTASFAQVSGAATLGGATVSANFAPGSYVAKRYTILDAAGGVSGTFAGLVSTNLPSGFVSGFGYDATHAYLSLGLFQAGSLPGLNRNQQAVAEGLSNSFDTTGSIPMVFGSLDAAGLTQVSGELATGSQQVTFDAMTMFMGVMTDPSMAGRDKDVRSANGGVSQYAGEPDPLSYAANGKRRAAGERNAYAAIHKAASRTFERYWSVWGAGYGGSQKTDGDSATGSNNTSNNIYGVAAGADYHLSPDTLIGFALAGGGTRFRVDGAGSGRSDLFQAGVFLRHNEGPAYLTAAFAYGWQDVSTERTVTVAGVDRLHASFDANAFSGRLEGGWRLMPSFNGVGLTAYAAGQTTLFKLPSYTEQAHVGANTFALSYAAKDVTSTRSELGLRAEASSVLADAMLTLRGRAAWAHNFDTGRSIEAAFQTLPGSAFVVNGAAQAANSALLTASAEVRWPGGWSLAGAFEGEFSSVTNSYAGKGMIRYVW